MTERVLDVPPTEHPVVSSLMALHRESSDALVAFVEHTTVPFAVRMLICGDLRYRGSAGMTRIDNERSQTTDGPGLCSPNEL